METTMPPRFAYSIREVSDVAPIGRTAIYEAINRGKLRAVKLGRRTLILDGDLRKFLASLPAIDDILDDELDADGLEIESDELDDLGD